MRSDLKFSGVIARSGALSNVSDGEVEEYEILTRLDE